MIIKDGHLYAATDGGIGYWNSATEKPLEGPAQWYN